MTKTKTRRQKKEPIVYPPGWNYQRAKAVADYYDAKQDEDVLGNAATTRRGAGLVWMEVPQELVPKIRALIAKRRKLA